MREKQGPVWIILNEEENIINWTKWENLSQAYTSSDFITLTHTASLPTDFTQNSHIA